MYQPSNPFSFWINENETKDFTFESGNTPYYVFLKQRSGITFSVIIFADSVEHVKEILRAAILFQFECANIYSKSTDTPICISGNWDSLGKALSDSYEEADDLSIEKVDITKSMKVSWASNDTIR